MKPSVWNVLKFGVGGVLSASLLVACADGRGSNGFRSYQYTKDEMAANKAIADAKAAKTSNIPVVNNPVVDPSQNGGNNNGGNTGTGTGDAGNKGQQGAIPAEGLDTLEYQTAQDSAKSKELIDNKQEPLQVSVDSLRKANELAIKKEVPALKNLVKGVTVTSNMADKQLLLNIDALVLIDGADHIVSVQNAAISYLKEGVTTALSFRLKKGTELVVPGKKLIITAICKDESCTFVQIRFMFENRAAIVVGYKLVAQGAAWLLQESNIGDVKDLNGGQDVGQGEDLAKKAKEAAAAKEKGAQLTEEQKAALAVQKAQEEAQAKQAEEAAKLAAENAAKLAAEKKSAEDAATLAAGMRLEQGYEEAAAAQAAPATPEQKAEVKSNSEDAAALAAGIQFEGAFERAAEAKQLPWQQQQTPAMTPASGESTEEKADPLFTPF